MPKLFGASYRRADLLRRIGRLEQVAGVRLVTLGDGQGRDVRVLEFRTGTGFAFDVLVDRGFDVGRCELSGRPLSWLSGAGVVAPWFYEPEPGTERGYMLEIGALPGPAAIGEFEARVSRLAASGEAREPGEGPATRRR